jgi:hypothetical protein
VQTVRPAFRITTPDGTNSASASFTLEGQAPVEVKDLRLDGTPVAAVWSSVTNWSLSVTLTGPTNVLTVTGHGRSGSQLPERDIGDYVDSITVYHP